MIKKLEALRKFERQVSPDQYFKTAQKDFRDFYNANYENLKAAEKAFRNLVVLLLKNTEFPEPKVSARLKDRNECIRKFDNKYRKKFEKISEEYVIKDHIKDLIGLRIICLYESDIDKVAQILTSELSKIDETNKTKELEDKEREFGYKGLHLDLILDDKRKDMPEYSGFKGQRFEVQIRTIVQDAWSEIDHKLKYKKQIPSDLRRRITRLAAIFELADQEFEAVKEISDGYKDSAQSNEYDESIIFLDVYGFLRVGKDVFPESSIEWTREEAIEQLVGEIRESKIDMTVAEFRSYLDLNIGSVGEYKDYLASLGTGMNPFTQVRHCLYRQDKRLFENLIFDGHKKNFDRWTKHGTVMPNEIKVT